MDGRYLNNMHRDTWRQTGSHYWVTVDGCRCCTMLEFLITFQVEWGDIIVELQ
jgi:hypothetical protein